MKHESEAIVDIETPAQSCTIKDCKVVCNGLDEADLSGTIIETLKNVKNISLSSRSDSKLFHPVNRKTTAASSNFCSWSNVNSLMTF